MSEGIELEKLDDNIAMISIDSAVNNNSEESCNNIHSSMDEMEKEGYENFIFNLEELNIASSRFVGLIAKRHYGLLEKEGRIALLKAQDMVKRSFEMSGLMDVLDFYDDREEAIESFNE